MTPALWTASSGAVCLMWALDYNVSIAAWVGVIALPAPT
jgi:Cu/Ag efflux pump CusA